MHYPKILEHNTARRVKRCNPTRISYGVLRILGNPRVVETYLKYPKNYLGRSTVQWWGQ